MIFKYALCLLLMITSSVCATKGPPDLSLMQDLDFAESRKILIPEQTEIKPIKNEPTDHSIFMALQEHFPIPPEQIKCNLKLLSSLCGISAVIALIVCGIKFL